jgi:DNA-binding CsgD family transcriptional regulator/tetratricopeptide (TPR) repeat protein
VIRTLAQTQPSALAQPMEGPHRRAWLRGTLDRIALLLPKAAAQAPDDPLAYALAFVERYHRDVPQLEHEWEFLSFALARAWHCADYPAVVRLADDLAYIVGRLSDRAAAEEVLRRGIAASRYTQDAQHLALFLSRLGGLLFSFGQREPGRRLWLAGQRFARRAGVGAGLREPLSSFAQISDLLGSYEAVRDFAERLLRAHSLTDPETLAVAVFLWGFRARGHGQLEEAHEHFSRALRLLALRPATAAPASARQIFTLTVQAELARVRGDFPRARAYTETVFSLARVYSDHYTVAALLLDQGIFTYYLGQIADCHATFAHLRAIAPQLGLLPIYQNGYRFLERQLAGAPHGSGTAQHHPPASSLTPEIAAPAESLSARELEVLRLVAEGMPNREIAARLVIAASTVKKHLEHIYGKLGTPSRTAAVARARALHLLP